jgi:hypothetical protein
MAISKSILWRNARRALMLSLFAAAGLIVTSFVGFLMSSRSHGSLYINWSHIALTFLILLAFWFLFFFFLAIRGLRRSAPVEEILEREPSHATLLKTPMTGFVAMEYYRLIWNRTFVVFVSDEGIFGWKASGVVTNINPTYYEPLVHMLADSEFLRDIESARKLAALRGGFYIPYSGITSVQSSNKQKWGMGGVVHNGRVTVSTTAGRTREFILLGSYDPDTIRDSILAGM